jgi:rubredoxin
MSILKNAVDSIVLGIEDYKNPDARRLVSATRNLVAGILLLYKHKLSTLSPAGSDEALIKQRVLPVADGAGQVVWRGEGTRTVDVQQIRERCESLGIGIDWKRVERIVKHRNDIEHYFTGLTQDALRSLVADSFVLIRDFVRAQLSEAPLDLLGADTWNTLTSVAEVYDKEKAECETNIETIDWRFSQLHDALVEWQCPECGSGLMDVATTAVDRSDATFKCRSCGKEYDFEVGAEKAVSSFYAGQNYSSMKDGDEPATVQCPNCFHDTYDLAEDCCLLCEESVERECQRCGMDIPACEIDGSGYCSWCSHMMAKDD